ncbi:MAG: carbon starvation CstA family protein [Rikenellaceae bacterium]
MITFLICLTLLVSSYFIYGRYVERVFGADNKRAVPSQTQYDGIDYVPMPLWRTFLIQLLNIAGLGPIFGAVLGAAYGPVAFLWITLGGIFFGAMHDYLAGMISLENGGQSLPEIIGKYLGLGVKQVMRVFILILMLLVGAVFMTGPAGIIADLTEITTVEIFGYTIQNFWIWVILVYYLIATLLPIDKVIGNIYPLFGAALIIMALGIMYVLFVEDYTIPNLTLDTMTNMKSSPEKFPIFTTLFITIACGALSGFHATQSPMMARCLKNERQGRFIFFGAMISESIIALIWAAVAMAFFGGVEQLNVQLAEHGNNATWAVENICSTTLGTIGGILAMLGVVAAPISTGDTAFRSARLIVADFLGFEQRSLWKRIVICIPVFILGYGITLYDFDVIWRSFAWANQTIAVATLWAITVYLAQRKKNYWVSLLPAIFMSMVVFSHFFSGSEMLGLPSMVGNLVATFGVLFILVLFVRYLRRLR